jgi:hypothetical protein
VSQYRNYFGVVIAEPEGRGKSQSINGRCAVCGYEIHWMLLPGYGSIGQQDALTAGKEETHYGHYLLVR